MNLKLLITLFLSIKPMSQKFEECFITEAKDTIIRSYGEEIGSRIDIKSKEDYRIACNINIINPHLKREIKVDGYQPIFEHHFINDVDFTNEMDKKLTVMQFRLEMLIIYKNILMDALIQDCPNKLIEKIISFFTKFTSFNVNSANCNHINYSWIECPFSCGLICLLNEMRKEEYDKISLCKKVYKSFGSWIWYYYEVDKDTAENLV